MRLLQLLVLGMGLGLSFGHFAKAADTKKFATLEVSVDPKVADKVAGIRTLFVIVYDNDGRMPYGAMKVDLKADAKGSVYKGDITEANIQTMGPPTPMPKVLRFKARLDKDGSAGPDQPGDLVGTVNKINAGDSAKIVINTVI